ncbi:MAG TPA: cytochrome c biogenesis heme-transporting ATPase CcmA [Stellaceae bacterium]|nr:cytochrome c biogenesis heme-transporting ATPase CcmA [Stellaceae bacterium]
MLESSNLAAQRGSATLFSGIAFRIEPGDALLVTGANGSGKTTLLRIAAGLAHAAAGTLVWRGVPAAPFEPGLRGAVVYIGHAAALKDELSAEENLASLASLHGDGAPPDAVRAALSAWSLERQSALPARSLSLGQRRRVGLARLELTARPLWILDEPASALDTAGAARLDAMLGAHLKRGGMAIVATHQDMALPGSSVRRLSLS